MFGDDTEVSFALIHSTFVEESRVAMENNAVTSISDLPHPVNCLSFDVEGFVESNIQSFGWDSTYLRSTSDRYEIETNTDACLELLAAAGVKATFFVVGRLATETPDVVRRIAQLGHEVACHSYEHLRISGIARNEFGRKLGAAKKLLEDVAGKEVLGFRAPEFSITTSTLWALDVLRELGFAYDSSIYPIGMHDVYGIAGATRWIHALSNGLIEFPLATTTVLGRHLPFGGGGYFRLYPLVLTELCLRRANRRGHACMLYIHPYEVGPCIPSVSHLSFYRTCRHYYNCANGDKRLRRLLKSFTFAPAIDVIRRHGYLGSN